MVTAGYKWQFCPYGVAFLYVDENYFDGVPIEEAWMGRDGAEDFSRLVDFTDQYQPGARRFDAGEKSSFSNIAGALAALQMLDEWGIGTISETLAATNARIAENFGGPRVRDHGGRRPCTAFPGSSSAGHRPEKAGGAPYRQWRLRERTRRQLAGRATSLYGR